MESGAGRLSPERVSGRSRSKSPPKQRFPDKFHAMLQAAQDAHIKAAHQRDLLDRRSLSVAMLVEGRADAFVDFFMLIQPPAQPSAQDTASSSGVSTSGSSSSAELPWQSMVLLQEQLVRADAANREHDLQAAFEAHRNMARHFTQLGMLENAVFFWKKCLQVRHVQDYTKALSPHHCQQQSCQQPCHLLSRLLALAQLMLVAMSKLTRGPSTAWPAHTPTAPCVTPFLLGCCQCIERPTAAGDQLCARAAVRVPRAASISYGAS